MSTIALDLNSANSTSRLVQFKLAQVDVETRHREATATEPELLENILKDETDKYLSLQQIIERDSRDKVAQKRKMLNHSREAKFYKEKISQMNINEDNSLELLASKVLAKREELKKLQKSLEEFRNLKPTNEALRAKIEELKKSRLSLEMTFVDEV